MKKYFIIAILILGSIALYSPVKRKIYYHNKFDQMNDSFWVYSDKFMCYLNCDFDSAKIFNAKADSFLSIQEKYYSLLYPDGNTYNKKIEEPKINCNCK